MKQSSTCRGPVVLAEPWPLGDERGPLAAYEDYAPVYDLLFGDTMDDVAFYLAEAERTVPSDADVVELGVGTGRLLKRLRAAGHRVVGVDACGAMLARARARLTPLRGGWRLVCSEAATMCLGDRFPLIIAPYGFVAHLLTERERRATYAAVYRHLAPGGWFVLDDRPSWISGPPDPARLTEELVREDPATGLQVRLTTNLVPVSGRPWMVNYDIIDWLDEGGVVRRLIIPLVFCDVPLADELAMLQELGFEALTVLGGFDGRPFNAAEPTANERLIIRGQRPDV